MSAMDAVHGSTAENTCCSRTRRAINCVYCPPKSSTTTPPRSEFGLIVSSCILPTLLITPRFAFFLDLDDATYNIPDSS